MKKYLIIIPARGGSKGIPKKNITEIAGKPLIQYTIEIANELVKNGVVDKSIISTDSKEIAKIAEQCGGEVPFLRPDYLSSDSAKSIGFMLHAVNYFERKEIFFDAIILLQPTSPLKIYEDISHAINVFEKNKNDSLTSVYREDYICDLVCYYKNGDYSIPLNKDHNKGIRRQDHDKLYVRNGAIYITDVNYLKKEEKIIGNTPLLFEMPKNRSINLDTVEDLELLRWMLEK